MLHRKLEGDNIRSLKKIKEKKGGGEAELKSQQRNHSQRFEKRFNL